MKQIGFALVDTKTEAVLYEWVRLPEKLALPTGEVAHSPKAGYMRENYRVVRRERPEAPPTFVEGLHEIVQEAPIWDVVNDRVFYPITVRDRSDYISRVKAHANLLILGSFPEWKQRNLIAEMVTLIDQGTRGTARAAEGRKIWAWIKSVRAASDTIESSPPADGDIENDPRWPAPYGG